ncbi:type I phosphomannose isomerase catalytic subunit, partial [Actinomadura livida]
MTAPMPLTTPIRPYDWGSSTALPWLLGTEPTGGPQAELWAGAHPAAPSSVDGTPLNVLIDDDPVAMLGAASVKRFGPALPYLLKVLAVEKPLSLQVHPTMAQAEAGFAAE